MGSAQHRRRRVACERFRWRGPGQISEGAELHHTGSRQRVLMGEGENAMSRKRTQTLEGLTDSAVTWFFVGLMLIAAIAAAFGQVVNS